MNIRLSPTPDWTCPHCQRANEAFGPGRCQHCGLHMHSEREQQLRLSICQPAVSQLQAILSTESSLTTKAKMEEIQRILPSLTPLEELQPTWQAWLHPVKEIFQQWQTAYAAFQRQWIMHLAILAILLLAPLLIGLLTRDLMLAGLLLLPVFGWLWIGIWTFRRTNMPR